MQLPTVPYAAALMALLSLIGCGGGSGPAAVRLTDIFDSSQVAGSPTAESAEPAAAWDFSAAPAEGQSATLDWSAGAGVANLRVVDGKLTGRSTTDFPLLLASLPEAADRNDGIYGVEIRIRADKGENVGAFGDPAKEPDVNAIIGFGRTVNWPMSSPLKAGGDVQTLTMTSTMALRMSQAETFVIRPVDVADAEFQIESIRLISQAEQRASIPSGVGWQGLGAIYRETIVSRSPETITMELDIPADAWLDLNLGTVEPGSTTFKIAAGERVLLERTLTTPHRWEPAPIELSGLSGPTTLSLSLEVDRDRAIGFWGSPTIRRRNARPSTAKTPGAALGGADAPQGVIVFIADTLRKDHLSAYGFGRETAPNLKGLAAEGVLFEDAVSQATWTKVSQPAIFTSLYPTSHRVHDFNDRLSAAVTTLAEVYRAAGYATVAYSSVLFTGKFTNLHQGYEELHEFESVDDKIHPAKTAREYLDRATDWIERHRDTPFYMFVHVFDPHDPFEPRSPYDAIWADPTKKAEHEKQLEEIGEHIPMSIRKLFHMPYRSEVVAAGHDPDEYNEFVQNWYDGSILGMDAEVGRFMRRLREMGLEDRVQFAFISDHGEEFFEHGKTFHGQSVYGELADVPLILRRPGVIPKNVRISETVRSIDLAPTLLDLSGIEAPLDMQGQSLVPLIAARGDRARAVELGWEPRPAIIEKAATSSSAPPPFETEVYGVVFDGWKLVHHAARLEGDDGPEYELFNHVDDPLDQHDVAAEHADIVEDLKARLTEWHEMVEAGKLPRGDSTEGLDSSQLDKLRSLGYIQ